jgi:hypothetical protein
MNVCGIYYRPHTFISQHTKKVKFVYKYVRREYDTTSSIKERLSCRCVWFEGKKNERKKNAETNE